MKRLYRRNDDRVLGGVCSGLGEHLGLDPLLIRVVFVVLGMVNGIGVLLYALMWALVPSATDAGSDQRQIMRHNVQEMRGRARELAGDARGAVNQGVSSGNRAVLAGAVLIGAGLLFLLRTLHPLAWLSKLWPLLVVAVGVILVAQSLRGRD